MKRSAWNAIAVTNGVGLDTTLPKPSSGGCTSSSGSLGILAALGLLPLLRRRRGG